MPASGYCLPILGRLPGLAGCLGCLIIYYTYYFAASSRFASRIYRPNRIFNFMAPPSSTYRCSCRQRRMLPLVWGLPLMDTRSWMDGKLFQLQFPSRHFLFGMCLCIFECVSTTMRCESREETENSIAWCVPRRGKCFFVRCLGPNTHYGLLMIELSRVECVCACARA